ncbi:MAG: energy-coupling factor transporter transmembrane component T [Dermatophilaceae bacterium]
MPVRLLAASPRMLHPVAWWVWGLGLATAAAHTTNPLLLGLVLAVAAWVVTERREVGARNTFRPFLFIGLVAIALRVALTVILGNGVPGQIVLLRLPQVALPDIFAGVRLGGVVTLESVVAAALDGLRLAATLACVGAANALASPRRLLRYAPATLYDVGTAVVVALTYAPQMAEHAVRVRSARRLRGHDGSGLRELGRLAVPVLEGSLDRSLELAASMEARGYGRVPVRAGRARALGSILALLGATGVLAGLYGVLSPSTGGWLGLPILAFGLALAGASLVLGARTDVRTAYRRDLWRGPEWVVCLLGALAAVALVAAQAGGTAGVVMALAPNEQLGLPVLPAVAIAGCALAGVLTPLPPRLAAAREGARQRAADADRASA